MHQALEFLRCGVDAVVAVSALAPRKFESAFVFLAYRELSDPTIDAIVFSLPENPSNRDTFARDTGQLVS
ncbi:hypothetical protein A7G45_00400 [Mycolicibacterium llatzerense]|nr:hypothetical protein [Mycolicibacterium llatzerense]